MKAICTDCEKCRVLAVYIDGSRDISCSANPYMIKLLKEKGGSRRIKGNEKSAEIECDAFIKQSMEI